MVKNFPQPYQKPAGVRSSARQFNNHMANVSQIPDCGYMDFNSMNVNQTPANAAPQLAKKKNLKGKQKNKPNAQQQQQQQQQQPQQGNQQGPAPWRKNKNMQQRGPPNPKFRMNNQRGFPPMNGGPMNMHGNMNMGANNRMPFSRRPMPMSPFPPHGMMPPMGGPPHMGPMRPPIPPMNMPPANPHFMRRNNRRLPGNGEGNFKKQMFPRPPMPPINMPMPPMMGGGPPRLPIPFNAMGPSPGKVKKPNPKLVKKIVKGKSTIKTLKNLQNQYPLDKPWVTDDIRAEHGKKVDIENQLKGKKDDDLFAQFKTQRDKFVALYEAAREEHLKKEAAQVKTKDANGKQTNNKNTAKNGKNNEQNANKNAKTNA